METINIINEQENSTNVNISKFPDTCPICHMKIRPRYYAAFLNTTKEGPEHLQVIYRCPSDNCRNIFIGFYSQTPSGYKYDYSEPSKIAQREFSNIIASISENFIKVYNQAHLAEQYKLDLICGAGYRKAFEFLIKDYLISKAPSEAEKIKKEFLGKVIKERVDDPRIKNIAKRATWLGNDETHYERRWEDKDINDLKKLIDLTIHWLEAEKLTEELDQDMPE